MDFNRNFDLLSYNENYSTITGTQYSVKTDLAEEPVTIDFFKQHARIDFDMDDTLIPIYLKASRIFLEKYSMLSFGVKTMTLTASCLPDKYKLMYGPVDTITTAGFDNIGDLLTTGGDDISIEYTTLGIIEDVIRVAICRYAAGLYINRENVIDTKFAAQQNQDESKIMLEPYRNIIYF